MSVTQTYAPNEYTIYLSPRDRTRFAEFEASLRNELASYLAEHARRAGYVMPTRPRVRFETESSLHTGIFGISTALVRDDEAPIEPVPPPGARGRSCRRGVPPPEPLAAARGRRARSPMPEEAVRSPLDPDPRRAAARPAAAPLAAADLPGEPRVRRPSRPSASADRPSPLGGAAGRAARSCPISCPSRRRGAAPKSRRAAAVLHRGRRRAGAARLRAAARRHDDHAARAAEELVDRARRPAHAHRRPGRPDRPRARLRHRARRPQRLAPARRDPPARARSSYSSTSTPPTARS